MEYCRVMYTKTVLYGQMELLSRQRKEISDRLVVIEVSAIVHIHIFRKDHD